MRCFFTFTRIDNIYMLPNPVFASLFLLVFAFFWVLVCGVISYLGGWYGFAKCHPYPENPGSELDSFLFSSLQFNHIGSYNNSMILKIYKEGISLYPQLLFRAFHPPVFIAWSEISKIDSGKEFIWFKKTDVYVDGNRLRFYGKASDSINTHFQKLTT